MSRCAYCPTCIDAGTLGLLVELMPMIAPERLDDVRDLLTDPGRWANATPAQRVLIADLLDACSRRMVDELGRDPAHLVARGDILPAAPESAAGAELPW